MSRPIPVGRRLHGCHRRSGRLHRVLGAVIAIVVLTACGGLRQSGTDGPGQPSATPSVTMFVRNGLAEIGHDRETIVDRLGPPRSQRSVVVPNRHVPGVQDTLYTLLFDGLTVEIHHPGGGGDLISSVEVTSNRYLRYPEVGIGVTGERVLEILGPPDEDLGSAFVYRCRGCLDADQSAEIGLEGGRVGRVRFDFYVD